jgi:putative hemolysin
MLEREPNFKIIANFLLHRIEPMKPYIMPVNPFENHKDAKSSVIGIKETLRHLSDGKPLGMFPAGEVSTYKDGKLVVDKPWEEGAIKVIRKAQVPVVPIYFHAKNSNLFYFLSKINDTLRTAKLPSQNYLLKKIELLKFALENLFRLLNKTNIKILMNIQIFTKENLYACQSFDDERTALIYQI